MNKRRKMPHEFRRIEVRICERCGSTFRGMVHARYCSQACTQAAYRDRKRSGGES
jgi:hypothetical protein